MPTHTAPVFTTTPTSRVISIHLIDASGDTWAEDLSIDVAALEADVDDYVQAYVNGTNASAYETTDTYFRSGAKLASNASVADRSHVESGINIGFKDPVTRAYFASRLVAPVTSTMTGNTDTPLGSSTVLTTLAAAIEALKTGFSRVAAQYTGHRERTNNTKTKF